METINLIFIIVLLILVAALMNNQHNMKQRILYQEDRIQEMQYQINYYFRGDHYEEGNTFATLDGGPAAIDNAGVRTDR